MPSWPPTSAKQMRMPLPQTPYSASSFLSLPPPRDFLISSKIRKTGNRSGFGKLPALGARNHSLPHLFSKMILNSKHRLPLSAHLVCFVTLLPVSPYRHFNLYPNVIRSCLLG